jgi:chorismate mutase
MYTNTQDYLSQIEKIDEQIINLLSIRQDIVKSLSKAKKNGGLDNTAAQEEASLDSKKYLEARTSQLVTLGKQKNLPSKFVRRFCRTVFHYFAKLK